MRQQLAGVRRPFFSFYGSKFRAARRYPLPLHDHIIEPFAGSAGYALRYANRRVSLFEVDPIIAGLWAYLIKVKPREIRSLPLEFESIGDLKISQEAKWLIGFWLGAGNHRPRQKPSSLMKRRLAGKKYPGGGNGLGTFWGEATRESIASQLKFIRHWEVRNQSYEWVPNYKATWFIDPPYNCLAGRHYSYHCLDYNLLAYWCESRDGQVIVCEADGATWLPFRHLARTHSVNGFSSEVIWTNDY